MISCTFENGRKARLRHVVVDAIVINKNKIILIKRAAHLSNGGKWAIPGGFLDRDETCEQAVLRELKEETGLMGKIVKLLKIIDNPKRKNEDRQNVTFVYQIETSGKIKVDPKEVTEAKWFDINNLPEEQDFAFDHLEIIESFLTSQAWPFDSLSSLRVLTIISTHGTLSAKSRIDIRIVGPNSS